MLTNEWIPGTGDLRAALDLREAVFSGEQHAEEPDSDVYDPQALHLLLLDDGRPVATGRIYHDGHTFRIGRCCVSRDARGQGIGDLLIKLLLLKTFEYNPAQIRIHAQEQVERFYERYGFVREGEPFLEAGIRHVPMRVDRNSLKIPSHCGRTRGFADFFEAGPAGTQASGK